MVRVALCSDDLCESGRLEQTLMSFCRQQGLSAEIYVLNGCKELEYRFLDTERMDIFYIDMVGVKKPEEVVRRIRESCGHSLIIFATDCSIQETQELIRESFLILRKPVCETEFLDSFRKACSWYEKDGRSFVFRYRRREERILLEDVLYLESRGRMVMVHLKGGDCRVFNGILTQVEQKLATSKHMFLRIHQSYLVNYFSIRSRTGRTVELMDGTTLPISESRAQAFKEQYGKLLEGEIQV